MKIRQLKFPSVLKREHISFIILMATLPLVLLLEANTLKVTAGIEFYFQDHLMRWRNRNHPPASRDIALISVSEETFETYDGAPPPRSVEAKLVRALAQSGASTIAFDFTFKMSRQGTTELAEASEKVAKLIYGVECSAIDTNRDAPPTPTLQLTPFRVNALNRPPEMNYILEELPHQDLQPAIRHLGHIMVKLSEDGARRHIPLLIPIGDEYYPALSLLVLCLFKGVPLDGKGVTVKWGSYLLLDNQKGWKRKIPIDKYGRMRINYIGDTSRFQLDYSFHNLERDLDLETFPASWGDYFANKLILIGNIVTKADRTATPFAKSFPGVAIHATAIDNILGGEFVSETSPWLTTGLTLGFTTALVLLQLCVFPIEPSRSEQRLWFQVGIGFGVFCVLALSYVTLAVALFYLWGRFPMFVSPLMTMLLAWILATSYCYVKRLEREYIHREALEREIQQKQKQAAYAQLATELNHRIKNCLTGLQLDIDKLIRRIGDDESNKPIVERTRRQLKRLEKVGTDFKRGISTYNQVQNGHWTQSNLNNQVVESVLAELTPSIETSVQVQTELFDHLPPLRLEVDWLKDALRNLIYNALDAMPQDGRLTITTDVLLTGQVVLTVGDTGEGIPDEDRDKIFTPWFTRKEEGSGMGLYMVQQVMLAHNGKVEFETQEGQGTEFRLFFPITDRLEDKNG